MNQLEIDLLFHETIQQRAISKKLEGISEDKVYNWRKGRGKKPDIGTMLGVLWQLNLITVHGKPTTTPAEQ